MPQLSQSQVSQLYEKNQIRHLGDQVFRIHYTTDTLANRRELQDQLRLIADNRPLTGGRKIGVDIHDYTFGAAGVEYGKWCFDATYSGAPRQSALGLITTPLTATEMQQIPTILEASGAISKAVKVELQNKLPRATVYGKGRP